MSIISQPALLTYTFAILILKEFGGAVIEIADLAN